MNKNTIIYILVLILVFGIGAGAYFYFQSDLQIGQPKISPTQMPTPQITLTPTPTSIKELPEEWEIYTSQQHKFQIAHPQEMETSINPQEGVRFLLSGPTQREATEVTDGILLIISSGAYHQDSFQSFVQAQADKQNQDPVAESVSEVRPINIDAINGYCFDVVSLGKGTYYYLNKEEKEYLRIIKIVQDPTDQGFEEMVNQIFSTLIFI